MINGSISIPPGAVGDVESRTCALPAGAKFWRLTMRTYKQGTLLRLLDGGSVLLSGSDWEHPPVSTHAPPAFHAFAGNATHECTYANPTTRSIHFGEDEDNDETCTGIGWFFPAPQPRICVDGFGPF